LLAVLGGKDQPGADDVARILDSVGIKANAEELKVVIHSLQGKNLDQLIAEGSKRITALPSGGGHAAAAPAGGAPAAKAEEKKAEEKPKKEEKPKEESGADMGLSLFD